MTDLLLVAVSDAFLDVGVVLALVAVLVGVLGPRCGWAGDLLRRHPSLGPLGGALLGVTPGCSGALVVTPLFARGHVSLGTLVATLLATTGDSAWAMWAGAPRAALAVHGVLLAVAVALGCATDAVRARSPRALAWCAPEQDPDPAAAPTARRAHPGGRSTRLGSSIGTSIGSVLTSVGADVTQVRAEIAARRPVRSWRPAFRPFALLPGLVLFWTMTGAGTAVALGGLTSPAAAGPDLTWQRLVGLLGFVACVGVLVRRRAVGARPGGGRLRGNLEGAAAQAATVVLWVAGAYALLAAAEAVAGPAADGLRLTGFTAVVVGTLVGALPGCGFQIAWVGLYLDGAVSFPGLLANALAQDGDALLPLLVVHRRAALTVTALTSVPALLVGGVAVLLL